MRWFVYALYNKQANKIYIGQTNNPKRRLTEHNQKQSGHYTAGVLGEWNLIYQERVLTRSQALKREKQLKSYRGRQFIKGLIIDEGSAPL